MERSRLFNILLVLLILIATLFLAQMLWQLLSGFADIILLFILGWILSFVLAPVVEDLCAHPVPLLIVDMLRPLAGEARANRLARVHLSRTTAVLVVYIGLLLVIVAIVALFIPPMVAQLTQLARHLPDYMGLAPELGGWIQDQLAGFGIQVNFEPAVQAGLTGLQGAASSLVQNALGIFSGLINFLANLFLILILSFYISLDGSRLRHLFLDLVPESFQREANYLSQSVNRTFGGFIRGQLAQAFLMGVGTAVVMSVFGLNFVLVVSLFVTLFMLIPLIGAVLALLPPLLVVLTQSPELAIWLLIILFIYQFVIVNVLMPRVLSNALGLHPLLVFAGILIGIKVGGFWGAFFGIPVVGVIWAMIVFLFEGWQRGRLESVAKPEGVEEEGQMERALRQTARQTQERRQPPEPAAGRSKP